MARIVYVHRNDGTDMRVSKECNSLLHAGFDVHFVGWEAQGEIDPVDPMPDVPKHLLSFRRGGGRRTISGESRFVLHVVRTVFRLRPDVVHVVNEEGAALLGLLRPFLGFRMVCDVYDSVALRHSSDSLVGRTAARLIAALAYRVSDILIVTDEIRRRRLGHHAPSAVVVANYPVDVGEDLWSRDPEEEPVRLYVAGTLSRARGLRSVLALLDRRDDVTVVSAGWDYDEEARRFVSDPGVEYHGVLTPADSLRLAASCDAIVALYEPSNTNNVLASPNKIYDALCIGRLVIINQEARVSSWVAEHEAGIVVRYGDVDDLDRAIDRLKERGAHAETRRRLRELFLSGHSWDVAERELLAAYDRLADLEEDRVS